ncbi:MAG: arylesterase [Bacteroidetes bacterium]|nr:MAG: arylesterase [Bacteroidota bacterium]
MKHVTLNSGLLLCVLLCLGGIGCGSGESTSDTAPEAAPHETVTPDSAASAGGAPARATVLILGNSLAAGAGVDPQEAFPARLQEKVDALGWSFEIVNAGLSGETSAGGLRRIDWLLQRPVDVLVLELGGNDGLRGIEPEVTKQNLQAIIDKTRARYPDVRIVLAGMQMPPNLGPDYTARFRAIYPELAAENDATLIPFLLEGVGDVPELMQADGIHPTAEGHAIVAETVWTYLRPVLEEVGAEKGCLDAPATTDASDDCEIDWGTDA